MSGSAAAGRPMQGFGRRRAARLAAVQALYQIDATGTPAETVLEEFLRHRLGRDGEAGGFADADRTLLTHLVEGTSARREDIDHGLSDALVESWPLHRLDATLRAILRVGAYELLADDAVPVAVLIDEYVDLAHAFFGGKEPGMVNAVLDRMAREFRPAEIADDSGGAALRAAAGRTAAVAAVGSMSSSG